MNTLHSLIVKLNQTTNHLNDFKGKEGLKKLEQELREIQQGLINISENKIDTEIVYQILELEDGVVINKITINTDSAAKAIECLRWHVEDSSAEEFKLYKYNIATGESTQLA